MAKKKTRAKKKILKEVFTMHPEQGAVAALCGLSRPGYKMVSINRKGTKCTVTYEKESED